MADFSNLSVPGLAQTRVEGLSELEQKLKELGPKQAKKAFREAGARAAEIWANEMASLAPVGDPHRAGVSPGTLRESIGFSIRASGVNETLTIHVGPSKEAFWGTFNEFGTKDMPARPFARPTFMDHQDDVLKLFADILWEELQVLSQ